MLQLGILIGSTRPQRKGEAVARWVHGIAAGRGDTEASLVDILDFGLPLLDEPEPASQGIYRHEHTRAWSARINALDAFVFVTPEYNQAPPAALKNAIDFLYREWRNKAAGFVSYGGVGGTRAVAHLRMILGSLQVAAVSSQVSLTLAADFEKYKTFKPGPSREPSVHAMLDQVIAWGTLLKTQREARENSS